MMEKDVLVKLVIEYFKKVDAGDVSSPDLFSEEVDFFSLNLDALRAKTA